MRQLAIGLLSVVVIFGGIVQPTAIHEAMYGAMVSSLTLTAKATEDPTDPNIIHYHQCEIFYEVFYDDECYKVGRSGCGEGHKEGDPACSFGGRISEGRISETPVHQRINADLIMTIQGYTHSNGSAEGHYKLGTGGWTECMRCGAYIDGTKGVIEPHIWNGGVITRQATETTEGERVLTCTLCGYEKKETIPKLAHTTHSWNAGVVTKQPTYTATGVKTYTCTVCNTTKTEPVPKLECSAHKWGAGVITQQPTCSVGGYRTKTCTVCGAKKTETVAATGVHTYDAGVVTKEPGCGTNGTRTFTCTVCRSTKKETIKATQQHQMGKERIVHEATVDRAGWKEATCQICGQLKGWEIPKLSHPAHNWDAGTVTKKATCTTPGTKTLTCTLCKETKTETIPAMSANGTHTFGRREVYIQPTETTTGNANDICTVCGELKPVILPKKEAPCQHTNKGWRVKTQPSSSANGYLEEYCKGCNKATGATQAYRIWTVSLGNGRTATVAGYFDTKGYEREAARLTNNYRSQAGLSALSYNSSLQAAANTRALEAAYSYSHTRPDGTEWYTADNRIYGENIAEGHPDPESVTKGWYKSPGHRENMLRPGFRTIAIGCFHKLTISGTSVTEKLCWSQVFTY